MPPISGMRCGNCGKVTEILSAFVCPRCDGPLSVLYDYDSMSDTLSGSTFKKRDTRTIWRYADLLPDVAGGNRVSLGEGGVPLVKCPHIGGQLGLENLLAKLENLNPTGAFKDRGSAVGVSFALQMGYRTVGCTSSGNMAASVAAYAARAGLASLLIVPSYSAREKLLQAFFYGAELLSTGEMSSSERYELSHKIGREKGVYMINSNSPMRMEGSKTFSFEVWEDLERRVPDWIVIPTSSGGNSRAIWKGFKELQMVGLTSRLPRLLIAQAAGCAPIVKAFRDGKEDVERWPKAESIASSVQNTKPPGGRQLLEIIRESEGNVEDATDEQIEKATIDFGVSEGIFCEPSSATGLAALRKAVEKGLVHTDDVIVLDVTGAGFKDLGVARKIFSSPKRIAEA